MVPDGKCQGVVLIVPGGVVPKLCQDFNKVMIVP